MGQVRTEEVATAEDGMRLDRWIKARFPDMPHGRMQKALRKGEVRVDGGRAKSDTRVAAGQVVRIPPYEPASLVKVKQSPVFDPNEEAFAKSLVIFRNASVLAISKPPGLAVQGGSKTDRHVDGMLDHLRFDAEERPRLVHRLDKGTSGVLLLARTRSAAALLSKALRGRDVRKIYWALTAGVPDPMQGTIRLALSKQGGKGSEKVLPDPENGQHAITEFRVLDHAANKAALVALWPRTGRTHQIRVHLAALETPILGDGKYGGAAAFPEGDTVAKGMHLHAREIILPSGIEGAGTRITAPPPPPFKSVLKTFEFETDAFEGDDPFWEMENLL